MSNPDGEKSVSKKDRVIKTRSKTKKIKVMNANAGNKIKSKRRKFQHKAAPAIYIGHIPHGFYEDEMTAYFNQFGKVQSAVVIRSKKTGRSRGFGFVEFENEEVAKIAAETMNNYLMFNRVLKCKYIPPEEGKRRKSVETIYPILPKVRNRATDFRNKMKAFKVLDQNSYQKKVQKKINSLKKFFEEKGMDFSFKVSITIVKD